MAEIDLRAFGGLERDVKHLRRAAKMAIEAALTPGEVAAATVIAWPAP